MLSEIEKKTTSLLADAMAARTHLSVIAAPGPPAPDQDGKAVAVVSICEVKPETLFNPERFVSQTSPALVRRILPVSFVALVDFAIRSDGTPPGLASARSLLLDDLALSTHFLAGDTIRSGKDFAVANPDPGFRVTEFGVTNNLFIRDVEQGLLKARLECRGTADVWPPGPAQQEGQIGTLDISVVAQPLDIAPLQPTVRAGAIVSLRVRGLATRRGPLSAPGPFAIAVRVLSDAPPEQRGTIDNGVAGAESNLQIVNTAAPDTQIQYHAPSAGIGNGRVEVVTIYVATPERKLGTFLGAVPVRVLGGN